jgi:cell division protease FtsH
MVCRFGMSDKLGTATYGRPMGARFLESPVAFGEERNFSEETARRIDSEVSAIMEHEHKRAMQVLSEKRHLLEAMTEKLLIDETLERADLEELLKQGGLEEEPRARLPKVGT